MKPLNISLVSYLNSKPFLFGLQHGPEAQKFNVRIDPPSVCAEKLIDGTVDTGLVPVAILPELKSYQIISDYCISADGEVSSVLMLSETPLHQIKRVQLDYQSRTSVQLVQILSKEFWKIHPDWISSTEGYEQEIRGNTAGVVIGDRALEMKKNFPYVYDLSSEWKKMTGRPFVFACWVVVNKISEELRDSLNRSLGIGLKRIPEVLKEYGTGPLTYENAEQYLEHFISFELDERKRQSMDLFLKYL
ncbi:MAG: menaquinone biosynthesis protein [Bacteroidia bacterium]|nr:menaquinone biosynthesis protein [Bacteroidia bacterium]